jgi:DNA-binding response OmpR family regulator
MKILLIEDNMSIRNVLRLGLEGEAFAVDEAEDGEKGSYLARTNKYDLIILDNVLPKKMAKQVCQEIRDQNIYTPILLLSAKADTLSKVELLKAGADDYVTKPFSFEELKARINTLLRRPHKIEGVIMKVDNIILDKDTHEVTKSNKHLNLTRKEFSLLELLMSNLGKVVTRTDMIEHVWDINADPFSNTLEAHILNLRKKVGDTKKRLIRNIPGRGYKMVSN